MKKLLLLFAGFFCSCHSDPIVVNDIELMGYYYQPNIATHKVEPDPYLYSSIDTTGTSVNLRKVDSVNMIGYAFKVNKNLIKEIADQTFNKQGSYFIDLDTSSGKIYCGPVIRFKISYSNGKEVSFIFHDEPYDKKSKFFLYKALYEELLNNPKTELFDSAHLEGMMRKEKIFSNYAVGEDSLLLPIPPFMPTPKIEEVKFKK